jgi:C_GCAxxG_C_C family probable redox protein
MTKEEQAVATFNNGFACSQAVFTAYADELNFDPNLALRISDSFGGGMGRMGLTCGAVTGAFMVIGLKYGRIDATDLESKQKTIDCVRNFSKQFIELNGSLTCNELLGCDISTIEGFNYALQNALFKSVCPKLVSDSMKILEKDLQ